MKVSCTNIYIFLSSATKVFLDLAQACFIQKTVIQQITEATLIVKFSFIPLPTITTIYNKV